MKIAMWSGPRNLSTACMYAFGNRSDFAASDEPFFGAFLAVTGIDHPMREETIAAMENDPHKVAKALKGPNPDGKPHWYQKHMCHHMIDGFPLDWAEACVNVHLIRHPARVIASYIQKRENPTLEDIGFVRQTEIAEALPGPIIDSADIRQTPRSLLARLCAEIGLPFDDAMLSWPPGPRPYDGAWAPHWYNAVHRSTSFAGEEAPLPEIAHPHLDEALQHYRALKEQALTF